MRKAFDTVVEEGKKLPWSDIAKISGLATALKTAQCMDDSGCSNGMFSTFVQAVTLSAIAVVAANKISSNLFSGKKAAVKPNEQSTEEMKFKEATAGVAPQSLK